MGFEIMEKGHIKKLARIMRQIFFKNNNYKFVVKLQTEWNQIYPSNLLKIGLLLRKFRIENKELSSFNPKYSSILLLLIYRASLCASSITCLHHSWFCVLIFPNHKNTLRTWDLWKSHTNRTYNAEGHRFIEAEYQSRFSLKFLLNMVLSILLF